MFYIVCLHFKLDFVKHGDSKVIHGVWQLGARMYSKPKRWRIFGGPLIQF